MYLDVYFFDYTQVTYDQNKSFLMGLKYYVNLQSNVHTRMFIPSEMRQHFEFIAEHALPHLHGTHS